MNFQKCTVGQFFQMSLLLTTLVLFVGGCKSNTIIGVKTNPSGVNVQGKFFSEFNRTTDFQASIPDSRFDEVDYDEDGSVTDELTFTKDGYREVVADLTIDRHQDFSTPAINLARLDTKINFSTQIVGENGGDYSFTKGAPASVKIQIDDIAIDFVPEDWPMLREGLLDFRTPVELTCTKLEAGKLQGHMKYVVIAMPDYSLMPNTPSVPSSAQVHQFVEIHPGRNTDIVFSFEPDLTTLTVITEDDGVRIEFDYGTGYEYIGWSKSLTGDDEIGFGLTYTFTPQEIDKLITEDTMFIGKPGKGNDVKIPVLKVLVRAKPSNSSRKPNIYTIEIPKGDHKRILVPTFVPEEIKSITFTSEPKGASVYRLGAPVTNNLKDGTSSVVIDPKKYICRTDHTYDFVGEDFHPKDGDIFLFEFPGRESQEHVFHRDDSKNIQTIHLVLQPIKAKPQ